jgi:hypothetical protein
MHNFLGKTIYCILINSGCTATPGYILPDAKALQSTSIARYSNKYYATSKWTPTHSHSFHDINTYSSLTTQPWAVEALQADAYGWLPYNWPDPLLHMQT